MTESRAPFYVDSDAPQFDPGWLALHLDTFPLADVGTASSPAKLTHPRTRQNEIRLAPSLGDGQGAGSRDD